MLNRKGRMMLDVTGLCLATFLILWGYDVEVPLLSTFGIGIGWAAFVHAVGMPNGRY